MTAITPAGATIPGVTHHLADVNGARLHYVSAGTSGSPVLLAHGWPESWWAFRKLIPLLAQAHRVFAVDLRGFGDSSTADGSYDDATAAEDMHHLVRHLGAGPVHFSCQDISGGLGFRFAATHPDDVRSLIAIETTLPGRERDLLAGWAYPMMTAVKGSVTEDDLDEITRTYARPDGWRGTEGLYHSIFTDDGQTRALAEKQPLAVPVLTVGSASAPLTEQTFRQVTAGKVTSVRLEGIGHLVAQEAPEALSAAISEFTEHVDNS
jgi:pimeloyl-ACP methyl ester carboxylesterase